MVISKFVSFLFIFEYYSNKIYENVEIIHLSSVKRYEITKQSKYYKIEPLPHVMKDNYNQAYNSIPDKICSHKYCKHCGNSNLGWHGISVQWHDFISWLPVKLKIKKKRKENDRITSCQLPMQLLLPQQVALINPHLSLVVELHRKCGKKTHVLPSRLNILTSA